MSARPLSAEQRRARLVEQFQPGTPANLLSVAFEVGPDRDVAGLRRALRAAVDRRPWLHGHRDEAGGVPGGRPADADRFDVPVVDLRHLSAAERETVLAEVRTDQATAHFDLDRDPPLRVLLVLCTDRTVVALTAHRVALDESSLGEFLREISAPPAAPGPAESDGPPQAVAPGDDSDEADGADGVDEEALRYWAEVLAAPPPPTLPTDRPRPLLPAQVGAQVPVCLPADAGALGTDLLLAAFQALLVRLGGGADVAVALRVVPAAAPGAAHPDPGGEAVIRTDLSDDPDLATVRDRVRERRQAAARHRVPLARLADALAPAEPRRDPFCSAAVVVRAGPLVPEPLIPLPPTVLGVGHELRLVVELTGHHGPHGHLEYATELFDRVTAERIAARYTRLLTAATADPHRPLSTVPMLAEDERRLVLDVWNDTATEGRDGCLHDLIAAQARLAPTAPAVVCGQRTVSYGWLEDRANGLARALVERGVGRGGLVALCARRGPDTVAAILAVLKAGAAYVPLDPDYPPERLAFMLADSRAAVVVTDAESAPRLAPHDVPTVVLDDGVPGAADPPPVAVGPDDACYVIYTSGSTGTPKGAVNTHRGVVNTMLSLVSRIRIDSSARLLQTSSLSFDMSAFDILSTLLAGGCLVTPEPADLADPARLVDLVAQQRVTVWSSAPPLFRAAVDEVLTSGRTLPDHLRAVVVGGDRFPPALCASLHDLLPGCRAFNVAGMTEVSFTTTAYRMVAADAHRSSVPWGMPLPNQRMYVLDQHGELTPPGVPGELYIGGVGVGRGYWDRPALTAERFLPDPFHDVPNARMYRTGDQVRRLTDGAVEFLGRLDHQVKVRGFRIELGEVERTLGSHPLVGEVVAAVRADRDGDDRLVAYVACRDPEVDVTVEELRAFLGARLPGHMVPSTFVLLDYIPLLPSGKIDRGALAAMPLPEARPHLATEYVPPRDELEQRIVEEWSRVLGVDRIGVHDDFVALGGHSMLATPAMAALGRALGINLSARDLYEAPTPARLATRARALTAPAG